MSSTSAFNVMDEFALPTTGNTSRTKRVLLLWYYYCGTTIVFPLLTWVCREFADLFHSLSC